MNIHKRIIDVVAIQSNLEATGNRMRKLSLVIGFVSILSAVNSTQAAEGQFYIAPGLQWMDFDGNRGLENDTGPTLGLGYDFTDRTSFELSTFDLDPSVNGGGDIDLDHYKLDMLYDLNDNNSRVTPFVVGGLGNTDFDGENSTMIDVGAGLKVGMSGNVEWRTAIRAYNYLGGDNDRDIGIDSSLIFYFGGNSRPAPARPTPAPAPEPAPAPDSDRDGVPDSRDECPDTPMNYAVDDVGCPIPVEEVARVELDVLFEFDRDVVRPQYLPEIEEVADFMEQYPDVVVELEGHTDSVGTNEYNQDLSQRRADAVRQSLIDDFDVQGSRITATGYGEEQPVATNDTAAGRQENRRVITVIIKTLQRYRPR